MLGISGIVRIFEEIEQRLVQSLKRSLGGGKEYDSTSWQAEKLRSLEKFRKENAELMQEYTEQIDTETRQLMQEQFDEGVTDASTLPTVQEAPEPAFFGVDTTKVNKLIEDMTCLEKNAETAALRMTDDVYRQTVNRVQLAMSTGAMTLQQAIDTAVKDFLNQGINCIVYSDGRRVNIADYVRMALRTTATRAALQGKSAKFKALGYDTVQVSSYSMCSKTCQPWQGRIYIEDTFSWWDGEVKEYPDGTLWGKSNYCGKWFPLLSSAIERGLFHPNCRHTIGLWRDGDPLPESVDNSDTEQRYKLEQQQRALEREIRKAKRKVNGLSDPDNVRKAKDELGQAQKELEDFVDKVNTEYGETVLKPDYGRTAVYEGEVEKPVPVEEPAKPEPVSAPEKAEEATESKLDEPTAEVEAGNVNNQSIDISAENGIIESGNNHALGDSSAEQYKPNYSFEPKVTPEVQEAFNEEYNKAVELYGEINTVSGVDVMTDVSKDEGNYNDNSRWISLRHAEKKNGLKLMAAVAQEKYKNGKWSTGHPRHAMRHEIGHAIQLHYSMNDKNWSEKLLKISDIFQKAIQEIEGYTMPSSYIGDDIEEFISECVAASFLNPKKQSKTVKAVFRIITGGA
jgi:hypothetical protein